MPKPLVYQGVPEIDGNAAEGDRRIQREDIQGYPPETPPGKMDSQRTYRSCGRLLAPIGRLVERHRLASIRIATLVFLATIEYSVGRADHCSCAPVVSQTEPGAEVHLVQGII